MQKVLKKPNLKTQKKLQKKGKKVYNMKKTNHAKKLKTNNTQNMQHS